MNTLNAYKPDNRMTVSFWTAEDSLAEDSSYSLVLCEATREIEPEAVLEVLATAYVISTSARKRERYSFICV
jgi:hypothetical protein